MGATGTNRNHVKLHTPKVEGENRYRFSPSTSTFQLFAVFNNNEQLFRLNSERPVPCSVHVDLTALDFGRSAVQQVNQIHATEAHGHHTNRQLHRGEKTLR